MKTNFSTIYWNAIIGVLGIVFIILKLTKVISWSWWLVLLPIYGPTIFAIVLLIIAYSLKAYVERKEKKQ